jgi:hypothetical protein
MAHKHGHGADDGQSSSTAYETRDVKLRPLLVFAAGLAVTGVVVYLVVFALFRLFSGEAAQEDARLAPSSVSRPAAAPGVERLPPEPRIQANAAGDMQTFRRREDAILTARIPIAEAMKQVLEEGLPVRQPDSAPPAAGTPVDVKTPRGEMKKAEQ